MLAASSVLFPCNANIAICLQLLWVEKRKLFKLTVSPLAIVISHQFSPHPLCFSHSKLVFSVLQVWGMSYFVPHYLCVILQLQSQSPTDWLPGYTSEARVHPWRLLLTLGRIRQICQVIYTLIIYITYRTYSYLCFLASSHSRLKVS